MGMSRVIEVNIDRVVLRGIDPSDRKAMIEGLEAELSRILADPAPMARRSSRAGRRYSSWDACLLSLGRRVAGSLAAEWRVRLEEE